MTTRVLAASILLMSPLVLTTLGTAAISRADNRDDNLLASQNASGQLRTFNTRGAIDLTNPFFQDLGTNGRRCVTCHQPSVAWTITPELVQERFAATHGTDPLFRANDGSDCEGVDSMGGSHAAAYSMLLTRAVIRVGIDVPPGAEFIVQSVDDPHHCGAPLQSVSMFRRPLPSTNLGFLSAVMWDGRESTPTTTIPQDLAHQSNDATRGHAQAALDLTPAQRQAIVEFETGLFTAQARDNVAGNLGSAGGHGGPVHLSQQPFFSGVNDPVGLNPTNAPFVPQVFTLYDAWRALRGNEHDGFDDPRSAIARGQQIFNTRTFTIEHVGGLNGETFASGVHVPDSFSGTCTICHDTPNAGNHSVKAPLNIGLTDGSRRTPDLPLYTLMNLATGDTVTTTDPGRAMITGKWRDIGKLKGPILRALAARAPYFHNGSAATLADVVDFYNGRFNMQLTAQDKSDLIAFLRAL
jgi:cytochrome c peroxidase